MEKTFSKKIVDGQLKITSGKICKFLPGSLRKSLAVAKFIAKTNLMP